MRSPAKEIALPANADDVQAFIVASLERATAQCLIETGFDPLLVGLQGEPREHTLVALSERLEPCIEEKMLLCLGDLGEFTAQGLAVQRDSPRAAVVLADRDVGVSLVMPVLVQSEGQEQSFERFLSRVAVRLAHLENVSRPFRITTNASSPRDVDLSYLASLDVNASVYEHGERLLYVLADPQSHLGTEQYLFVVSAGDSS
jgi:hypothetical protein